MAEEDFESAKFVMDTTPVIHPAPVRIPADVLAAARPAPTRAFPSTGATLVRQTLPTVIVAAFAIAWTLAGFARHDLPAYALGFVFTLAVVVGEWDRENAERSRVRREE